MNELLRDMESFQAAERHSEWGKMSSQYQFWIEHQSVEQLVNNLKKLIPPDAVVLDAGCGDGTLAVALAPFARQVVGVDLTWEMVETARKKVQDAGLDNVNFIHGDLEQLAVSEKTIDVVICSFALHHTPVEITLPVLREAVKPGGWLYLQEPSCQINGHFRSLWYRWQGLRVGAAALRSNGFKTAWHITGFHQSRSWISHQLNDNHWNIERWLAATEALLPESTFKSGEDHSYVSILWQRPSANDGLEPLAGELPSLEVQAKGDGPFLQVIRQYPSPPPNDYIAFPRSAVEGSVVERFEAQVAENETSFALQTPQLKMTYGELNAAANRTARRLFFLSEKKGVPVAILMDQEGPVIPALLGVLKAGKAYVVIDPGDTLERQERVIMKAGVETLVTTRAKERQLSKELTRCVNTVIWDDLESESDTNLELPLGPDSLAAIFFTSGSTGEPKGVFRDHRQFLHSTWVNTNGYYVSSSDRQSLLYSPGFTASVPNIYDTLLNGATLCSINPRHVSPSDLLSWLQQEKITHFNPPIGLWRELVQAVTPGSRWPDLRLVTLVGQAIYGKDIRDFQSLFGINTVLLYALGMTEAGAVTHGYYNKNTAVVDGPVPVGYPLPDKEVEIVDEAGNPLPTGEAGRVAITSLYLSLGYWQDAVKTYSNFKSKNDGSGLRTFITSDRGQKRFDGCLEFFGRQDSVIKIRGFRVDTAAIEAALNSHPHISQAVVVPRKRIYGDVFLVAYLTGTDEYTPSVEELHFYLGQSLPHYMTADRFSWLDKLPLTASGKINRQVLSRLSTPRPALSVPFVEPETDHEQRIAQIWAELLELDQIGVNDDWVELGGDSLLAMRMIQLVERRLGMQPPSEFSGALTIKQLSRMLTTTSSEQPVDLQSKQHSEPEQETSVDNTHFIQQKAKGMLIHRPKKLLRRIIRKGPVWGDRGLSYAVGARLQWLMVNQLWLLKRLYARQLASVLHWQEELENQTNKQSLKINLLANTWLKWRDQELMRSGVFKKWVRITGEGEHLFITTDVSAGTVFLIPHTGWMMSTLEQFIRGCGRETAIITIDLSINNAGGTERWHAEQIRSRTGQLWKAQQVLQRKGVVFIAGDGRQGNQSVDVAFHGRQRPFQTGAAWLAVMNNSHFVPVFARYESSGHIEVDVNPALISDAESKEEQIIELTQKYGRLYAERWPQFYTSMDWTHLLYNFNLPRTS